MAGWAIGHWIVSAIRGRKARKWMRDYEAAKAARLEREYALRAQRARRVQPLPHTRLPPPGAFVDSTGAINPRIPIRYFPKPR